MMGNTGINPEKEPDWQSDRGINLNSAVGQ